MLSNHVILKLISSILLIKCAKINSFLSNQLMIFKCFVSVDIFLFSASRLHHEIAIITLSDVQFLHFMAENGASSFKFLST